MDDYKPYSDTLLTLQSQKDISGIRLPDTLVIEMATRPLHQYSSENNTSYPFDIASLLLIKVQQNPIFEDICEPLIQKLLSFLAENAIDQIAGMKLTLDLLATVTKNPKACHIFSEICNDFPPFIIQEKCDPESMERIIKIFYHLAIHGVPYSSIIFFGEMPINDLIGMFLEMKADLFLSSKLFFFVSQCDQLFSPFISKFISKLNNFQISPKELYAFNLHLLTNQELQNTFLENVFQHFINYLIRIFQISDLKSEHIDSCLSILNTYFKIGSIIICDDLEITQTLFLIIIKLDLTKLQQLDKFENVLLNYVNCIIMLDNFIDQEEESTEQTVASKTEAKAFLENTIDAFLVTLDKLESYDESFICTVFSKIGENTTPISELRQWFLLCEDLLENVLLKASDEEVRNLKHYGMIE